MFLTKQYNIHESLEKLNLVGIWPRDTILRYEIVRRNQDLNIKFYADSIFYLIFSKNHDMRILYHDLGFF